MSGGELPDAWPQVAAWRARRREELSARREAVVPEERRALATAVNALVEQAFAALAGRTIAYCWPYRAEIDLRFAIRALRLQGATAALPVVVGRGRALEFRAWWPGVAMARGPLGIPSPTGTPAVVPDAAFVPVVGFDAAGYRLGYGGGYFDRTLAASETRPLAIGVGAEAARLPTIHPQPHDIAMDFIVTEAGVHERVGAALARLPLEAAAQRVALRLASRG
jgi:5-formyltetrahydrofolate cyclo-ligase